MSTDDGAVPATEQEAERKRQRSTIEFSYNDLEDAIGVANTIYQRAGDRCGPDQLAAWMGHESIKSGTFRTKVSAARLFGFVEVGRDQVGLTRLGQQVIDQEHDTRQARVTAFLNVPLYRRIYDTFKGRQLPPDAGLEQAIVNFGVSFKQGDKARQAFQRSAEQAGFFYQGRTRLVLPAGMADTLGGVSPSGTAIKDAGEQDNDAADPSKVADQSKQGGAFGGGSNQEGQGRTGHILLDGLFQTLPPAGHVWADQDRQVWVDLAQSIFNVVYKKSPES